MAKLEDFRKIENALYIRDKDTIETCLKGKFEIKGYHSEIDKKDPTLFRSCYLGYLDGDFCMYQQQSNVVGTENTEYLCIIEKPKNVKELNKTIVEMEDWFDELSIFDNRNAWGF